MAQGRQALVGLLAAFLLRGAAAHGWVKEPVSLQDLTYRMRGYTAWQQGMPEAFRYEPWSARIAPGERPSGPGGSCGANAGAQYGQGLQLWRPWFEAAGIPVPSIRPGGEIPVTVEFTADHGGQAWLEIACSDTLGEDIDWILLERAADDRAANFMAGLPTVCAWNQYGGCTSIRWVVPATFSCPSGRAVGRWVWKVSNTCVDADNLGIDTEAFSMDEWRSVTGNQGPKCGADYFGESPEHFVSCFVFSVEGAGPAPSPVPATTPATMPTTTPATGVTPTPATTPAAPTPAPTPVPQTPACVPIGDCGEHHWCIQEAYIEYCGDAGLVGACPAPFCRSAEPESEPEPEPFPVPTPAPSPSPTTAPPAPMPSPEGACVPTNEGLYNNPDVYGPWCEAASVACPAPMCKRAGSLLDVSRPGLAQEPSAAVSRRHVFLGTALIQSGVAVERAAHGGAAQAQEL